MASEKPTHSADLNALAAEALDLWQEHLAAYANDPAAKAELMKLMEPQRQLFADWAVMMQNGLHGTNAAPGTAKHDAASAKAGAAPAAAASDDGALRLAQLAHRTAQLEKHVAELEKRLLRVEPAKLDDAKPRAAGKTAATKRIRH